MITKDIFVFVEQRKGEIQEVGIELIGEASRLIKTVDDFKVKAVLVGNQIKHKAKELIEYGADEVIVVEDPLLYDYNANAYTKVLEKVINEYHPDSFLIGASVIGRDLAPRVASRVETGLTADATILEFDPENPGSTLLWITRPAFGGNLFGTIICPDHRPQMATIRPGVLLANSKDLTREGVITLFDVEISTSDVDSKIIEEIEKEIKGIDITKAEIIISCGRGAKNAIEKVEKCAKLLGATVGASRALVDEGLAAKEIQVGQTGKTVRPRVYIACGISGAVQHLAGMEQSDYIIAINSDKNAAIFGVANLGIVGKVEDVIEEITTMLLEQ
jgi:electron transfer flavoprotein alpha subunit